MGIILYTVLERDNQFILGIFHKYLWEIHSLWSRRCCIFCQVPPNKSSLFKLINSISLCFSWISLMNFAKLLLASSGLCLSSVENTTISGWIISNISENLSFFLKNSSQFSFVFLHSPMIIFPSQMQAMSSSNSWGVIE